MFSKGNDSTAYLCVASNNNTMESILLFFFPIDGPNDDDDDSDDSKDFQPELRKMKTASGAQVILFAHT